MGLAEGPDGSVIAEKYLTGEWAHSKGEYIPERYPTNREVASSIEQQVSASVETYRKYRLVAWYTLFVALYMMALYYQASSFKCGEVVATLKASFLPDDGSTTIRFSSENEVLQYIGNKIITPIWKDPVCGNGKCDTPWEFPAWGPFGCQADCGLNPNVTKIIVSLTGDFSGHPSLSPSTLMNQVSWNLCLNDTVRLKRGLPQLCWFKDDQVFSEVLETQIKQVNLIDGHWYIRLEGDLAGKVTGGVYDATQGEDLVEIPITPKLEPCKFKRRRTPTNFGASPTVRRLLSEFTLARSAAGAAGEEVLQQAMSMAAEAVRNKGQQMLHG